MSTIKEQLGQCIEELRELRNSGMQVKDIAKKYNVNEHTMSAFLVNNGICWRRKLLESDIPEIVFLYNNGYSMENIAKKYRVTQGKISEILKEQQVYIRSANEYNRKYDLNESYFDVIDDQNKAYIIGLLIADGNCHKDTVVRLQLQESDKSVLDKIRGLIGSSRPLRFIDKKIQIIRMLGFSSLIVCICASSWVNIPSFHKRILKHIFLLRFNLIYIDM